MTEETKEQPKGLFDKFMDLYAPLAGQGASLSPEDYAQAVSYTHLTLPTN